MEIKVGKIPQTVLTRSVLKQKKHRRAEVQTGFASGMDASQVQIGEGESIVLSANPVFGPFCDLPEAAVYGAVNNLVVKGAEPIGILTSILLPAGSKEEELRALMQELERVCERLGLEIIGGHTEVAAAVSQPVMSVTGVGKKKTVCEPKEVKPSDELVMTWWAGWEGAAILAKDKEEQLRRRYSSDFLESAREAKENILVWDAAKIGMQHGAAVVHDITGGGVFGALWEIAEACQIGFTVDLKKIPIRQETVEICEFFELNPYLLTSKGCLIMVTEHGNELVQQLGLAGIPAAVIGRITADNDKIITNEEETRYLEPPKENELAKTY